MLLLSKESLDSNETRKFHSYLQIFREQHVPHTLYSVVVPQTNPLIELMIICVNKTYRFKFFCFKNSSKRHTLWYKFLAYLHRNLFHRRAGKKTSGLKIIFMLHVLVNQLYRNDLKWCDSNINWNLSSNEDVQQFSRFFWSPFDRIYCKVLAIKYRYYHHWILSAWTDDSTNCFLRAST